MIEKICDRLSHDWLNFTIAFCDWQNSCFFGTIIWQNLQFFHIWKICDYFSHDHLTKSDFFFRIQLKKFFFHNQFKTNNNLIQTRINFKTNDNLIQTWINFKTNDNLISMKKKIPPSPWYRYFTFSFKCKRNYKILCIKFHTSDSLLPTTL